MQRRSTKLYQTLMLVGASALALSAAASSARAQEAAAAPQSASAVATDDNAVAEVVVTGTRASLRSAQAIKRDASQMVDSIVATDIGKLPDHNVAEALQRIPGIQIARNYGEGGDIAIRGLTQVRTEINGRDSFTASGGRGLSLEDVPSELLAGVDVYKNPSADLIEGGIGGLVNLRTRMPFDFSGAKFSASIGANRYDLAKKTKPLASAMVSDRWDTKIGEIGLLYNIAYQEAAFRQDDVSIQPFYERTDIPGYVGQSVRVPYGAGVNITEGGRKRLGQSLAAQWRPTDNLEIYSQINRSDYKFKWFDYSQFAFTDENAPIVPAAGSTFKFDQDGEFLSGAFQNVADNVNTSYTSRHSITTDYSLGGKWTTDRLTVSTDFQYVKATTKGSRFIVITNASAPLLNMDISGKHPSITVSPAGYLTDPANFGMNAFLDHLENNSGEEKAWRGDVDYRVSDDGFLRSIKAGVRYADRSAVTRSDPYRYVYIGQPLTNYPGLYATIPFDNFMRGKGTSFGPVIGFDSDLIQDYDKARTALGTPDRVKTNPNDINTQSEKTWAGYVLGKFAFDLGRFPVDGNVGVRVVDTKVDTSGFLSFIPQVLQADGVTYQQGPATYTAVDVASSYTKALPSLNLRMHLTDTLQWRVAFSKALSRPTFDQLNPNLAIAQQNPLEPQTPQTAIGGNPNLKPLTADQFDTSLEWYFSPTSSLYGSVFYKKVDGFIANVATDETYFGRTYSITRPQSGDNGKIKGFEVGYTQFFDFLPGLWSGLGVQANYTYVDSKAPSPGSTDTNGATLTVPLEGLSKNSYNLVGIYEKGPISARLAYNWRSTWVVTTKGNGTGGLPLLNEPFGQLDGSVNYEINDHLTASIEASNMTDTMRTTNYGLKARPHDYQYNDRRIGVSLRVSY
jgi:TonB-dependent receptor